MLNVFYKVFNEADFLKESLENIYDYCDKITILESSWGGMRNVINPDRMSPDGLSADGTTELIQDFINERDPDKKIIHEKLGAFNCDENLVYQYMIDHIDIGDYMWVIDGDIVYSQDFAKKLYRLIMLNKYDVFWVPEVVFWQDLYHNKIEYLASHQRIVKKPSHISFYFPSCYELHWLNNTKQTRWYRREETIAWEDGTYYSKFFDPSTDFAYHYAYVRDNQRILEKLLCQYDMIDRKWQNVAAREHCIVYDNPLRFKLETMGYFNFPIDDTIAVWEGSHPENMKNNKWMSYHWDEQPRVLTYEQASKLVNPKGEC